MNAQIIFHIFLFCTRALNPDDSKESAAAATADSIYSLSSLPSCLILDADGKWLMAIEYHKRYQLMNWCFSIAVWYRGEKRAGGQSYQRTHSHTRNRFRTDELRMRRRA